MDVRAIILIGAPPQRAAGECGRFGPWPLGLVDVLGKPVLSHVIEQLERQGVTAIAIISESDLPPATRLAHPQRAALSWSHARASHLWRIAENVFNDHAQAGADEVLILRLGPYVEIDLEAFLQAHLDGPGHVTRAVGPGGMAMDIVLVSASRRNDAAFLFRHQLRESRSLCGTWPVTGYCRRLESARDLRCLAVDGLLQRNRLKPAGEEIRPGVWVGRRARIHRRARVVAPAYVGAGARISAHAVVTRCSVIERHAHVRGGTVIEDATLLPYTSVGAGLDIVRAVAGSHRMVHLERNVDLEIDDPRLLDALSPSAAVRALSGAASLLASLPVRLVQQWLAPARGPQPASLPAAVPAASPALNPPAAFSPSPSAAEASTFPRTWH